MNVITDIKIEQISGKVTIKVKSVELDRISSHALGDSYYAFNWRTVERRNDRWETIGSLDVTENYEDNQ